MDSFLVEQTSTEILRCLGGFSQQWGKLTDAIEKVGRGIESTQRAFEELNGPRRRVFEKKLGEIDELQARAGLTADDDLPSVVDLLELDRRAG
jgi:DNA recombination protein RmuC